MLFVLAINRRLSAGVKLADELTRGGAKISFEVCDLRDIAALQSAFARLKGALGPAGVLVNNAARDDRHGWTEVTPAYYDERIATNLRHMFFAIQTVAPDMIAAGKGSIINFGSNSWFEAVGGMPVYTTSKAAVHGMTRSFARDLGKHRIRVNTIVPGWIDTPMTEVALHGEAFMGKVLPRVPMRRWGVGDDFGGIAVYLASDASRYHTGDAFVIDGGYLIF